MTLHKITVTTAGGAGVSAGTAYSDAINGTISAILIDYTSMPATTDLVISEDGGLNRTILTLTNTNADKTVYPSVLAQGVTGADLTAIYAGFHLSGQRLKAVVAQGDDAAAGVIITVDVIPDRR